MRCGSQAFLGRCATAAPRAALTRRREGSRRRQAVAVVAFKDDAAAPATRAPAAKHAPLASSPRGLGARITGAIAAALGAAAAPTAPAAAAPQPARGAADSLSPAEAAVLAAHLARLSAEVRRLGARVEQLEAAERRRDAATSERRNEAAAEAAAAARATRGKPAGAGSAHGSAAAAVRRGVVNVTVPAFAAAAGMDPFADAVRTSAVATAAPAPAPASAPAAEAAPSAARASGTATPASVADATHLAHGGALHKLHFDGDGTAVILGPGRAVVTPELLASGRLLALPCDPDQQVEALAWEPDSGRSHAMCARMVTDEARAAIGPRCGVATHMDTPAAVPLGGSRVARKHVLLCGALRPVFESAQEQFVSVEAAAPDGRVGAKVQWLSRNMDLAYEEVYLCVDDSWDPVI